MKWFITFIFLITPFFSPSAQEYLLKLHISHVEISSLSGSELEKWKAYDGIDDYYPGSFHLNGATLPLPYSPVYRWKLFLPVKQYMSISLYGMNGLLLAESVEDTLSEGVHTIEIDHEGLFKIKEFTKLFLEVNSTFKSSTIEISFWGTDNLWLPDDGLILKKLNTRTLLSDSLSITSTISKDLHHIDGWLMNIPKNNYLFFKLISLPDSSIAHWESQYLKPDLYELKLSEELSSGRYQLLIEMGKSKIEQKFFLIR